MTSITSSQGKKKTRARSHQFRNSFAQVEGESSRPCKIVPGSALHGCKIMAGRAGTTMQEEHLQTSGSGEGNHTKKLCQFFIQETVVTRNAAGHVTLLLLLHMPFWPSYIPFPLAKDPSSTSIFFCSPYRCFRKTNALTQAVHR